MAKPQFAFLLCLTILNEAKGCTLLYAIETKRVKHARSDKGRIPLLELIAMVKSSEVDGVCVGICLRTTWYILLAFDNSMLHNIFQTASATVKVYWCLIQSESGLYCVNAHTMLPFAITHDKNNKLVKESVPKFDLKQNLENITGEKVALVEASKSVPHIEVLSIQKGLHTKTGRLQGPLRVKK